MKTIDDFEISPKLPPVFAEDDWVSVDIEVFGAKKGKLHRPIGEFASLAMTADGQTVYMITGKSDLDVFSRSISKCGVIFQKGMFDIRHLRRWVDFPARDKYHDTLYVDRILWSGYYDRFNLQALVRRYLYAYLDKEAQGEFEDATELTPEMIRYNARDAVVQWRVAMEQMKLMKKSHQHVWHNIDQPATWAFLEFKGIRIDVNAWEEIATENQESAEEKAAAFEFNPRSPVQVKEHLATCGVVVENTNAKTLSKYKNNPEVQKLLSYRKVEKRRSTYGFSWLSNVEEDGKVYTDYDPNLAESGRTASSNPNLQNIPVRDTPVFRKCFVASPGHIYVAGDYGQQEIRCAAYESQDKKLIALLKSKEDIYAGVASDIHERKIAKSDIERQKAKGVVLGAIYGLTKFGLQKKLNDEKENPTDPDVTLEQSDKLLKAFFAKFPELAAWCDRQRIKAYDPGYVRTPAGRICHINPHSHQAENNALNSPNQGGGGDMLKVALAYLLERWDRNLEPFPAVWESHDEIGLEVLEENMEYAEKLLYQCMLDAGEFVIPGIPVAIDMKHGYSWHEVH